MKPRFTPRLLLFPSLALLAPLAPAQTPDTTPPSAPPSLHCTAETVGATRLEWAAASDDIGVAGYFIYRNGALIGTTTTDCTFTDTTTTAGHTYRYSVTAYDTAPNESPESPAALATFAPAAELPAFPGAEGFGARITGGRGGEVVYVTNLNATGPGSFFAAMSVPRRRYVLFKVSGVNAPSTRWDDNHNVREGDVTVAGQTSPAGVVFRGLYSAARYGSGSSARNNMVFRHLRSRQGVDQDNLRLLDSSNLIVDHCSFAWAGDECAQISQTFNHTIQNSIFAETLGSHWDRGGILVKYSSVGYPLDTISFHHNLFYRIGGRLPVVDCDDGLCERCETPDSIDIEISHNVLWDPGQPIYLKAYYLNPWGRNFQASFRINYINNYAHARSSFPYGMFGTHNNAADQLYYSGNKINIHPNFADAELVYCCNNFLVNHPNTTPLIAAVATPHPFPSITGDVTGDPLIDVAAANFGAFPRDPMDRRFIRQMASRQINPLHQSEAEANDAFSLDWITPPPPPLDSDDDGMPDAWELHNGLNPLSPDHTGKQLSMRYTGVEGYDNIECYINRLSDHLVSGAPLVEGTATAYPVVLSATASPARITPGVATAVVITVAPGTPNDIAAVELSAATLLAPYTVPSPARLTITTERTGDLWTHTINVPANRDPGSYEVLIHVLDRAGRHGYALVPVAIASTPDTATYAGWRSESFAGSDLANDAISGPAADPDGAGVTNLQRFGFGLAARGPVANPVTLGTVSTAGQTYLTLSFNRRAEAPGLTYTVEASTDLATWAPVPGLTYTAGTPARVTAQDTVPIGTPGIARRFLRVRVSQVYSD
jgi:hypothetical protein